MSGDFNAYNHRWDDFSCAANPAGSTPSDFPPTELLFETEKHWIGKRNDTHPMIQRWPCKGSTALSYQRQLAGTYFVALHDQEYIIQRTLTDIIRHEIQLIRSMSIVRNSYLL